ncbi:related to RAD23-nucleotide excision repair protein (ubiquitin-like protein) [Sporisorium reilianum SRZ2]|uniref:UV excision repair protein RAD23 n=1 Tax=Sporisorium reilianum (strain SRZ2) TaxID=999809 RepID=E6ZYX2_SPORE|nr:related to RAD23-nucleotide excision repair protein (ubiquitin-like protein) [Sporisorium reilianum SRZ2]
MKLLIKSLAGGNFHLDAELTDTIGSIKAKIQKEQGHAPELQKIIFSGKILTDDKTVADCNIKEKDFLVVMVSKPKAPKPAAAPAAAAASTSTPAAASAADKPAAAAAPAATPKTDAPAAEAAAAAPSTTDASSTTAAPTESTPAATESQSSSGTSGSFLTGGALESAMQSMMEMGFERDQVQRAMRAAFNNPDRAVEYLMTGIPEHLANPPAAPQPSSTGAASAGEQTPSAAGGAPATPAAPSAGAGARVPATPATPSPAGRAGNLFEAAAAAQQAGRGGAGAGAAGAAASAGGGAGAGAAGALLGEDDGSGEQVIDLGNPAMLAQLQQLVQQNPAALQPLVQAIAQSNPQLAEAMNHDPQGVLALLAGGAAAGGDEMELPTLAELSDDDRAGVEQIVAMGIPESKAIESYFMCGKNVEMAVQYYFENPQDFED